MAKTISNELIYEVLKNVQSGISNLEEDSTEIKTRLTSLESGLAGLRRDNADSMKILLPNTHGMTDY